MRKQVRTMRSGRTDTVRSVERAIAILKAFSPEEPELGVGRLSQRLNLPKSTVSRLLATLEAGGLVTRNPDTGLYRLGVDLIGLANNVIAYADVRQLARPYLRSLAHALRETVSLAVLDRYDVVNLEQVVPPGRQIMRVGRVGRHLPVHASAAGKSIIAFLPERDLNALLDGRFKALTPHTITDLQTLRAELTRVREQGYATAFEELEEGLHAVSAPIFNHEGRVVASISVSGPAYRLRRERIKDVASQVVHTAAQISREMGALAHPDVSP